MSTKKKIEPAFTKEALLKSKRFCDNRDIVSAVLEDGVEYTVSDVEKMITNFMKGKVK